MVLYPWACLRVGRQPPRITGGIKNSIFTAAMAKICPRTFLNLIAAVGSDYPQRAYVQGKSHIGPNDRSP